jgi:hypothetical protein
LNAVSGQLGYGRSEELIENTFFAKTLNASSGSDQIGGKEEDSTASR